MHKIILVGDSSVGKTSIIRRYCDGNFIEYYNPDVGKLKLPSRNSWVSFTMFAIGIIKVYILASAQI